MSHCSTEPSAMTRLRPTIWVASTPRFVPVPWVEVDNAPATVWTWMSPRFGRASPTASSDSFNALSGMPAWTVTRLVAWSTSSSWSYLSRTISTPSVRATPVKLCPAPTALDLQPFIGRPLDDVRQLRLGGRVLDTDRAARLVAAPVDEAIALEAHHAEAYAARSGGL